jgi:hypothetical protein
MVKKTGTEKSDRTEILNFKVTAYEKDLIVRSAEEDGRTVADFIRGHVFMGMVMDGNLEAMKFVSKVVANQMRHKMKSMVDSFVQGDTESKESAPIGRGF